MSLSSALLTAKSSLTATSKQTSIVSRNLSGANDPNYTRRIGSVVSGGYGTVSVNVMRTADEALLSRFIQVNSKAASASVLSSGVDRLSALYSADDYSGSPAALIGDLRDAMHAYATAPGNNALGDVAVNKAVTLADALNEGTRQIQSLRSDADAEIATSVAHINELLGKFESINSQIMNGTQGGRDISELLDQRDGLLKQLSGEIGISTMMRSHNDMVIFADNGVTLFETVARKISFASSMGFTAGSSGNAVLVDGVPLNHETFDQPYGTGRLSGLLQLRDRTAPDYQAQLDEIARGLVAMFAETDQSANNGPAKTGLFIYAGSPLVPNDGVIVPGIAGTIRVSSAFIRSEGGDVSLLRDGGSNDADINGSHYVYNSEGAAGFSERLLALGTAFGTARNFDTLNGVASNKSLMDFSTASTSWLEGQRQSVNSGYEYAFTLAARAEQALSHATGVDIDTEMALLLELEHSYKASSRILATVDAMLNDLFAAVR